MARTKGWLHLAVRDYLYEQATMTSAYFTVEELADIANKLRVAASLSPYTANGAVRRAVNELVATGEATKHGNRPAMYKWDMGSFPNQPIGWESFAQRMTTAKTAATTTNSPADARAVLHGKLIDHMGKVTGQQPDDTTTETDTPAKPVITVKRPNGEDYRVRTIGKMNDVDFLRNMRENGLWSLLQGRPGTGKTSWIDAAFGEDLILFPGQESTTVDDLFGSWIPTGKPGDYEWVDGPATEAMKNGLVLFMDDITLINPKVLGSLYPIMDGRGITVIPTHMVDTDADGNTWPDGKKHPEQVKAAEGFYIIGAHNPGTNGAVLSDALSSRFMLQIEVSSDLDMCQQAGVPIEVMHVARSLETAIRDGESGWMPEARDLFDAGKIVDAMVAAHPKDKKAREYGIDMALANLLGKAPEEDQEIVLSKIQSVRGSVVDPLRLGKQA